MATIYFDLIIDTLNYRQKIVEKHAQIQTVNKAGVSFCDF